jgi:O-antigen ligase
VLVASLPHKQTRDKYKFIADLFKKKKLLALGFGSKWLDQFLIKQIIQNNIIIYYSID